jgi:hypothetical protein
VTTTEEASDVPDQVWRRVLEDVDGDGFSLTDAPVVSAEERAELQAIYDDDRRFRSTVVMARHQFGEGEYRYFANPLPPVVARLRRDAYGPLAELANVWAERLRGGSPYPAELDDFLTVCRRAGQTRPTPLLLRYEAGGWNALHQDLYGEVAFPLQVTVALTEPGTDFTGGENLLVEQRPRAQSRGSSVTIPAGHALVFATRDRPVRGTRGYHRTQMRHGVSTVTSGRRCTLGIIFHDAA